jgi:MFS family permease
MNKTILQFILCWIICLFGGINSSIVSANLSQILDVFLLNEPESVRLFVASIFNGIVLIGWSLGGVLSGLLADKIGRKQTIIILTSILTILCIASNTTNSWHIFALYRFLSGAMVGGLMVVTTTHIAEIISPEKRAISIGILANSFAVGIMVTGIFSASNPDWKQLFYINALVGVLLPLLFIFLKNSELFTNRNITISFSTSSEPLFSKTLVMASLIFGAMLIGLWALFSWMPTWAEELVPLAEANKTRGIILMCLALGGIVGAFSSGFLANIVGRKPVIQFAFLGLSVLSILVFYFIKNYTLASIIATCGMGICIGLGQGTLSSFIPEMFPTKIRAGATGLSFNLGRIITGVCVFFVGVLVPFFGGYGNSILAFSVLFIVGLFLMFFVKDTKDTQLI